MDWNGISDLFDILCVFFSLINGGVKTGTVFCWLKQTEVHRAWAFQWLSKRAYDIPPKVPDSSKIYGKKIVKMDNWVIYWAQSLFRWSFSYHIDGFTIYNYIQLYPNCGWRCFTNPKPFIDWFSYKTHGHGFGGNRPGLLAAFLVTSISLYFWGSASGQIWKCGIMFGIAWQGKSIDFKHVWFLCLYRSSRSV